MKKLNVYNVIGTLLEEFYSGVTDFTAEWPDNMLEVALILSTTSGPRGARAAQMAANAINLKADVDKDTYIGSVDIPGQVRTLLGDAIIWPEAYPTETSEGATIPLEQYQTYAVGIINHKISALRARYITAMPGQEMIYANKEAEAKAFLAESPEPTDLTPYPFIAAETGITAATPGELAALWVSMAATWRAAGAQLEALRMSTIVQVSAATTVDGARAALDTFNTTVSTI